MMHENDGTEVRAVTFSSSINAYMLYCGAAQLGIEVLSRDEAPLLPIPKARVHDHAEWLAFTEEASLLGALRGEHQGKFLPSHFPMEILDDKWETASWLQQRPQLTSALAQWPIASVSDVVFPCVLKAKHSWLGDVKLPRGWICRTAAELQYRLAQLEYRPDWGNAFFIQEWLGDSACRIVSVCGFHDASNAERNLTAVVERIASHEAGMSCSAAVETIDDQWSLVERTTAILDEMDFTGPYEMEYIVSGPEIRVLELNPRFWLQHSIFFQADNGLIKRYFGMDTATDRQRRKVGHVIWVDGLYLTQAFVMLRWRLHAMLLARALSKGPKILISPSIPLSARISLKKLWRLRRKIPGKLRGLLRPDHASRVT